MKRIFVLTFFLVSLLSSCLFYEDEGDFRPPLQYRPVVHARADLDQSIRLLPPQEIVNSGKIYLVNDLLFVGEERRGFHVFDNSDETNPTQIKFLQVLGASDVAVRNNILFINQARDLISLEYIFEKDSIALLKRIENTFPRLRSPSGDGYYPGQDSVVIEWQKIVY